MNQEAVRFAASVVFRDRIVVCGKRSFAYTLDATVPVITELANPVLGDASGRNPGTKADALNGIDYVGQVGGLRAEASRRWLEGKGWLPWVNGLGGGIFPFLSVMHQNGKWVSTLDPRFNAWKETTLDCASIRQLEATQRK